jgi:tetratricopeptide (TPR) repeat protein
MKPSLIALTAVICLTAPSAIAQLPPLGQPASPPPAQPQQGLPPLGGASTLPPLGGAPAGSLSVEAVNADLKTARAANQERRFADAETLMLKDTAAKPGQPYLWIELGLAQLGQKKYPEAESSFNAALSGGDTAQSKATSGSFYTADGRTASGTSGGTVAPPANPKVKPEVDGLSWSNLGEIYIRTHRIPEAKDAFDKAAAAYPAQAGLYYGNETVFLFQAGNSTAQLEAANKAIAVDPTRARNYYFKAQALTTQATVDPKTQKLILPPGCLEAYQKYLELDPNGQFAPDTKAIIAAAGASLKPVFKK